MQMKSEALVPSYISQKGNSLVLNAVALLSGLLLLTLLAKISIPLPFSPVPITGQTFGVALIALLWGAGRASAILALYIAAGASGVPVFAPGTSGLVWGPTMGYLAGMLLASIVVGRLSDRGWAKSFSKAFFSCLVGSLCIFSMGILVLSRFVPSEALLAAGFFPFIVGYLIKNLLAASLVSSLNKGLN